MARNHFMCTLIGIVVIIAGSLTYSFATKRIGPVGLIPADQQQDEYIKQEALSGSIATSTVGRKMIYRNTKYKYAFTYSSMWVLNNNSFQAPSLELLKDTYYINNDSSSLFNYRYNYKIDVLLVPTAQAESTQGDDGMVYKISTSTLTINGNTVLRADILAQADGGPDVSNNSRYNMRTYRIRLAFDPSRSLAINSYYFGTSTADFSDVDNLVKSITWWQ